MRPARLSAGLLRSFSRPSRPGPCFHPPSWRHAVSSQRRYSTVKSSDNHDTSPRQSTEAPSAALSGAEISTAESLGTENDAALEDESTLPEGSTKPYYVTTPIFYVNAAPHVGHMYTMVLADVLKRWQVLRKRQAYLCTGTDEHGMKVQRAAAKEGRAPQEFCDDNAAMFRRLAEESGIWNDYFIRTTDADHAAAVEAFWQRLVERGYIYESTHEGWYSVSDECFYPASAVETRYVPLTAKTIMASAETGSEVEWTKEKNYHFRMTALKHRLLEFYEANPDFIVPRTRMNEVVDWVKNNLEDLSVSRPVDRLDWGIRVPKDPSQTIYVWVDALVNYITYAGYPNWGAGEDGYGKWPADVQVVGKDIVRFHGVYWPALLMAVDLPPPKQLLSHAHWTMSKQKMSKSVGNVVNPFFAVDRWGVDAMRWYMLRDGGIEKDSDYSNEQILERYQHDLQGQLGNLLQRITRSKAWNHTQAVEVARGLKPRDLHEGVTFFSPDKDKRMEMTNAEYREVFLKQTRELREQISYLQFEVTKHMEAMNPPLAAKAIMQVIKDTNKYMSVMQPWNIEDRLAQYHIIYTAAEALRICGILLQPFMPSKMGTLLTQLGVARRNRSWKWARFGWDQWYGITTRELKTGRDEALFPPPITTK